MLCPLLSVLLDLGIRSPDRSIVDGTDLVPWDLVCEGSPDLFGEVCRRWVIVMCFGVIQWCFHWVFSREFALEGPHSQGGRVGTETPEERPWQGSEGTANLGPRRDHLQVEGLPVWCSVLVARMEDLSDVL